MLLYELIRVFSIVAIVSVKTGAEENRFKLRNQELWSFFVSLNVTEGMTLVSRRVNTGVSFYEDDNGHLKIAEGLCVITDGGGVGDRLHLGHCGDGAEIWSYQEAGDFVGLALGPSYEYCACWDTGDDWKDLYKSIGEPLRKTPMQEFLVDVGCTWTKVPV